jgi:hypothetical protein
MPAGLTMVLVWAICRTDASSRRRARRFVQYSVRPWKFSEESTKSDEQVVPETRGVTAKLLAAVDLGPEV